MKRFKILLFTILLCLICAVPIQAADNFLKDGKYWTEDTLNPWFLGSGVGIADSSYKSIGPKYASPSSNGNLYVKFNGGGSSYYISESRGVSYTVRNERTTHYLLGDRDVAGNRSTPVFQIELANVSGSGMITFRKRSDNTNKRQPEYLYLYVNHPKKSHNYTYQSDATYHWGTCGCGATTGKQTHTNVNGRCSVCGRVLHTHNPNKKVWVKQPTCTSSGSYYLACSTDNTRMTNDVSVPATGHRYGNA